MKNAKVLMVLLCMVAFAVEIRARGTRPWVRFDTPCKMPDFLKEAFKLQESKGQPNELMKSKLFKDPNIGLQYEGGFDRKGKLRAKAGWNSSSYSSMLDHTGMRFIFIVMALCDPNQTFETEISKLPCEGFLEHLGIVELTGNVRYKRYGKPPRRFKAAQYVEHCSSGCFQKLLNLWGKQHASCFADAFDDVSKLCAPPDYLPSNEDYKRENSGYPIKNLKKFMDQRQRHAALEATKLRAKLQRTVGAINTACVSKSADGTPCYSKLTSSKFNKTDKETAGTCAKAAGPDCCGRQVLVQAKSLACISSTIGTAQLKIVNQMWIDRNEQYRVKKIPITITCAQNMSIPENIAATCNRLVAAAVAPKTVVAAGPYTGAKFADMCERTSPTVTGSVSLQGMSPKAFNTEMKEHLRTALALALGVPASYMKLRIVTARRRGLRSGSSNAEVRYAVTIPKYSPITLEDAVKKVRNPNFANKLGKELKEQPAFKSAGFTGAGVTAIKGGSTPDLSKPDPAPPAAGSTTNPALTTALNDDVETIDTIATFLLWLSVVLVILALAAAGYYYYKYGLPDCLKSSDQQDSKSDYGSTSETSA